MCSVVAGLTALAGYTQYRGQQESANAQAAAYNAQAQTAEQNAKIEGRKQEQIADNYARQSQQLEQRQRIIAGQQRAQAGAAGLNMAGSPLDILSAGYDAYTQDQQTLLSNQRNDNYNSRVMQNNYLNQAAGAHAAAHNVKAVARMQGLSTILGTAASIYGSGVFKKGIAPEQNVGNGNYTHDLGFSTNTTASWSPTAGYAFTQTMPRAQWLNALAGQRTTQGISDIARQKFGGTPTDWLGKNKYRLGW